MIEALNLTRIQFNTNCRKLQSAVNTSLIQISELPYNVHKHILRMVDEEMNADYRVFIQKFHNMANKIKRVFDGLGNEFFNTFISSKV